MANEDSEMAELFEAIAVHLAEGIVVARLDTGEIVYTNPFFNTLFGYQAGELAGKPLAILGEFKNSSWQQFAAAISGSIHATGCWQEEVQHIRKDGSTFWCSVNASLFELKQSGGFLLLVQRDITAQKLVQDALKESEQLRKRAQRLALIGHWLLNPHTTALSGTDELYQIFELPKGVPLSEFNQSVHPDDRESTAEIMQKTLENTGRYDSTYRLLTKSGTLKWVHAIGEAIYDEHGFLTEIAGAVQDITALKIAEDELQKMQKLQSLGVMAGGIAHDFNNINTLIFGSIALAKSKMDAGHPAHEVLEIAEKSLQRATNLSSQLLTFAKGGAPVKKDIDLKKLIEDVTKLDLTGSNIRLDFTAAPGLWKVHADAGQIEQVITNLAINACQAMPDGGFLHIQLNNMSFAEGGPGNCAPGDYVRVKVADDGEGIADEILLKIFDPYFSTKPTGSGLGLATVYSIVKKHGGSIEVASKVGQGTTFLIYLPAAQAQEKSEENIPAFNQANEYSAGRVLVMDDEKELGELVQQILELKGFVVELVLDGADAIAKYRQALAQGSPFDCIIMDLTIPGGIGGKDAIREILLLNPDAKVIVSSGYAEDPVMANYRDYGFKGVIPKPYTPRQLTEVVQEVLCL